MKIFFIFKQKYDFPDLNINNLSDENWSEPAAVRSTLRLVQSMKYACLVWNEAFADLTFLSFQGKKMAPAPGFEPGTKWLTATYSTAELRRSISNAF